MEGGTFDLVRPSRGAQPALERTFTKPNLPNPCHRTSPNQQAVVGSGPPEEATQILNRHEPFPCVTARGERELQEPHIRAIHTA
jgi:hypothetical protein